MSSPEEGQGRYNHESGDTQRGNRGEHVLWGLRQEGYDLILAIEREARVPAPLDVERLARALHYSTWACPTGQTVIDWCDPHRGELFHVSQAQSIAAEYARLSNQPSTECQAEYEPGRICRRDKGHGGQHSRVRFNADEQPSTEPAQGGTG